MALTDEQKRRLIAAYEPILYFHPDEQFVPVDPVGYVENSALWCTRPADSESRHDKENWGGCRAGGEGDYPHEPMIPKEGISVDPAHDTEGSLDPDNDDVNEWYLGHQRPTGPPPYLSSTEEGMLWLESSGWEDSEEVTADSCNYHCGVERAIGRWQEDPLRSFSDRYYADVEDFDSLNDVINMLLQEGINPGQSVRERYGRAWFILYHFFYPIHQAGDYNRWSYEGDWGILGLMIPEPESLRPLDDPDEISAEIDQLLDTWEDLGQFPSPVLVGFGRRGRGVPDEELFLQRMDIFSAEDVTFLGSHPRIFVARGSHNLYATTGPQEPPSFADPSCEPEAFEGPTYEETGTEMGLWTGGMIGVYSKIITGGVAGGMAFGPIGAVVGFLAGLLIAAPEIAAPAVYSVDHAGEFVSVPSPTQDFPPESGDYGLILVPSGLVVDFPDADDAVEVRPWVGTTEEKLLDRDTQVWWASIPGHTGYDGRWGVMCQNDPCDCRSGMTMPHFRYVFLEEIAIHLS
jgi:hypothetical protein